MSELLSQDKKSEIIRRYWYCIGYKKRVFKKYKKRIGKKIIIERYDVRGLTDIHTKKIYNWLV